MYLENCYYLSLGGNSCYFITLLSLISSPLHPSGELDANRPVPFRLTPSLSSLISPISLSGPLQLSMVATARCLVQPHFSLESILRTILRDEFIAWKKVRDREDYVC